MNKGVFYVALSAVLYGCIGYFGANLMHAGFSVCDLLLWRFFISLLMFLPGLFFIFKESMNTNLKDLFYLFLISATFYAGGTACYFEASRSVGTGLAMVLFFTYPIFVAILSIITKKSPVNAPTFIALILIVIGSFLIAFGDGIDLEMDLLGLAYAFASGLGYGLYVFGSKESSKNMPTILSSFVVCAGNTVAFCLFSYFGQQYFLMPSSQAIWTDIILFALIGTVLPIFLLLRGMKTLSANKASIIGVLEPVAVLAVGAFILHEEVTWLQLVGAIIILLSAVAVQFEKDPVGEKLIRAETN